jgi:hypothetical protein
MDSPTLEDTAPHMTTTTGTCFDRDYDFFQILLIATVAPFYGIYKLGKIVKG